MSGLLAACGAVPEAGEAPGEEALGSQQAAMCLDLSVTSLTMLGVSSDDDWVIAGGGDWQVSSGSNAVRLEYYLDGVLRTSDERMGSAGSWHFSERARSCGWRSLLVKAIPMVVDSLGNRTICWSAPPAWTSQSFYVSCPPVALPSSPFQYSSLKDMRQACLGIAGRSSFHCDGISDSNDRLMCQGLAQASQQPCTMITDRNLQLACYGMSVAPYWPTNCRDITDANMRNFCYGVSSHSQSYCNSITNNRSLQLFCYGMSAAPYWPSNCRDITDANNREFCYALSSGSASHCSNLQ